jgi:hypothetical protein
VYVHNGADYAHTASPGPVLIIVYSHAGKEQGQVRETRLQEGFEEGDEVNRPPGAPGLPYNERGSSRAGTYLLWQSKHNELPARLNRRKGRNVFL